MSPIVRSTRFAALVAALVTVASLSSAPVTRAGQVRVSVGLGGQFFSARTVNVNPGDLVCWVWTSGSHSVTSGDSSTQVPSGVFDSGVHSAYSMSWKATSGTTRYFCTPHAPDMAGRVIVSPAGTIDVPDLHITEVQFNDAGNLDRVEIGNLGPVAANAGKFRLAVNSAATAQTLQISAASTDLVLASGDRLVVHLDAAGTNSATDLFLPGTGDLPAAGSVALYAPNQLRTSLALADQIVDFVQWGAGGQANEATAVAAGLWQSGAAITGVADGHSIEFCGQQNQHGATFWSEVSVPNFGVNGNCATPAGRTTWGRIKTLYR